MRIDRDAAPVVAHAHAEIFVQLDLNAGGVAGNRLVHGIVEHLGEQMVHAAFVGAADIHRRTPAHRLEALEHLDVLG